MEQTYYANALLSDGKLLFWWTGRDYPCDIFSFYKDFGHAHIDQVEYFKHHKMEVKSLGFIDPDDDTINNHLIFEDLAKRFYKRFEISPDSRGERPY